MAGIRPMGSTTALGKKAIKPKAKPAPVEVEEIDEDTGEIYEPKRKTKPTELAVRRLPEVDQGSLVIPDDTRKKLESRFGKKSDLIINMLEESDNEGGVTLLSRNILQMLVDVMPLAENNIRVSNGAKGIHGLNMLVSSMREMINDLQATRDRGMLGQSIVDRYIRPAFMDVGVQIQLGFTELEASAKGSMERDEFMVHQKMLHKMKSGIASYLMQQYEEIKTGVIQSLS